VTGYGLDDQVSIPGVQDIFLCYTASELAHAASYAVGTGICFLQVKAAAHHSSPSSAEEKKVELHLYSPIRLHGLVLD
jgi:hypothetical protein